MHDNRKIRGLNGARIVGQVGLLAIILKKISSRQVRARRSLISGNEPDYLGGTWENVEMMRRRMTI